MGLVIEVLIGVEVGRQIVDGARPRVPLKRGHGGDDEPERLHGRPPISTLQKGHDLSGTRLPRDHTATMLRLC